MIHWESLFVDFDRPWKGNNVASVAVQMWAK